MWRVSGTGRLKARVGWCLFLEEMDYKVGACIISPW
jgi:hypothetical protein